MSIDAFVELQHDITIFISFRTVVLGKFHVDWALLWALTEGKSEVHLAGSPVVSGGEKQCGSDSGPTDKRRVGVAFIGVTFKVSTEAPSGFELVEATIRVSFDAMTPSAGNRFKSCRD